MTTTTETRSKVEEVALSTGARLILMSDGGYRVELPAEPDVRLQAMYPPGKGRRLLDLYPV